MYGILGAGLSGLAFAHFLLKKAPEVTVKLIEASQRTGGWVNTIRTPTGQYFELGPRTVRPKGERGEITLKLICDLHLDGKVKPILSNHPAAKNRLIYVKGKLHKLPSSFSSLFLPLSPFSKPLIFSVLNDIMAPTKHCQDESIYDFAKRRMGKEIADYAVSPMICGICAGDAKQISVRFLMNTLFEAEQKHGAIYKGIVKNILSKAKQNKITELCDLYKQAQKERWSVWSLENGLETLPKALENNIIKGKGKVQLNAECREVTFLENGKVLLRYNSSEELFDHVISALPASKLAPLLKKQHPKMSSYLDEIKSVSVGLINLQFRGKVLKEDAFGFLVPSSEKLPILGIVFDSCCFPTENSTILTVMMGGHWFLDYFGPNPTEETLLQTALVQTKNILGITQKPEQFNVSILRNCIPQYTLGHYERIINIKHYIQENKLPLTVIGASYDGVGVNDVIWSAKQGVEKLF